MRPAETAVAVHGAEAEPSQAPRVSVVIPCLDEEDSIAGCVARARAAFETAGIDGEVVVVDNGSSDATRELAHAAGATVVQELRRGYGSAYQAGFAAARGEYILMADGDGSYDLGDVGRFVDQLDAGADLVVGSRLTGKIQPGAMPWLHRRIGNPLLTGILNLFFRTGLSDAHCGMRAFRRSALERLDLRTTGMEFASEQVIRSSKARLDIREIPIEYGPRRGSSKLCTFSDGWRHLRLLLVHSPTWLFLVPGAALILLGLLASLVVLGDFDVLGRRWHLHTLIAGAMLIIVGSQIVQFGAFARAYAFWHLGEQDRLLERARGRIRLETGLLAGLGFVAVGVTVCAYVFLTWLNHGFGALREEQLAVVGLMLVVLGIQTVFGAFLLTVLALGQRRSEVLLIGDTRSATVPSRR